MDDTTRREQAGDEDGRLAPPTISLAAVKAIRTIVDEDSQMGRQLAKLAKGHSLNKFDAEELGDHALNTTISSLKIRHGIVAERCLEKIEGYRKRPTSVMRYWLSEADQKRASKLLGWSL